MLHVDVGSRTLAGNERWFLAHTLPKSEWKAELHLGAQGFRTFQPQIRKTIRHARRLKTVRGPLFPRYLFVILDLERDRWLSVRSTVGVASLFGSRDGRPVPVPVGIVESLIARSEDATLWGCPFTTPPWVLVQFSCWWASSGSSRESPPTTAP
jgi:hypothetical protein